MSRTIINTSDGLNSWDIEQSTSVVTNTGVVIRVITAVNDSEKIDAVNQSTGSTSSSISTRAISGVSDGLNSWDIEQSTGTTTSTTIIRYINPPTIVPNLLSLLQARATYYENAIGTTTILTNLENCNNE